VRIDAIAVCAANVEIMKPGLPAIVEGQPPFNRNFTIGHDYMGTIVKLGASVDEFDIGHYFGEAAAGGNYGVLYALAKGAGGLLVIPLKYRPPVWKPAPRPRAARVAAQG
jgi:NADPH:quinone reductase-like Zn-dependent oxidoreductase